MVWSCIDAGVVDEAITFADKAFVFNRVNIHTCDLESAPNMANVLSFGSGSNAARLVYLNGATVTVEGVMVTPA